MKITRPKLISGAIATAAAAALLPAAAAVAFISPPLVLLAAPQSPAHLVARGAAVDVTIEHSCTATDSMFIDVLVTERVGGGVASGAGFISVPCDGATHVTVVRLHANPTGRAFAKGRAAVQVSVFGCFDNGDTSFCGSDSIGRTIRVRR